MDTKRVLEIAKTSLRKKVIHKIDWEPKMEKWMEPNLGVFTTLYKKTPKRELRGCVGIPKPEYPVGIAIAISARRSATEDPRFEPVTSQELDDLTLSVEVLSDFDEITYSSPDELYNQINIGEDGLMVKYENYGSLFLPRVPVDQDWTADEYVKYLCRKAWIPSSFLGIKPLKFFKFTTQYFAE